jgi:hypothetical protein
MLEGFMLGYAAGMATVVILIRVYDVLDRKLGESLEEDPHKYEETR